jgi:hypothetical protein
VITGLDGFTNNGGAVSKGRQAAQLLTAEPDSHLYRLAATGPANLEGGNLPSRRPYRTISARASSIHRPPG